MQKSIILIVLFLFIGCKKNEDKSEILKNTAIKEIVETIIIDDSLNVLKAQHKSRMLCNSLVKLKICVPKKIDENGNIVVMPVLPDQVSVTNLLHYKVNHQSFFSTKDSLFLMNQNSQTDTIAIDNILPDKINYTTSKQERKKLETGKSYNFYEITIPIFSSDYKTAYVELNQYCGGLCGSGKSIFMKKINGKWKIMASYTGWMS